jgi:dienelactone hydrolase
MKRTVTLLAALLLETPAALHADDVPQSPLQVWADYDPNRGDFKTEILSEDTKDGILNRECYISAYVLGEDLRVYCKYSVKAGATKAPGLLNVRGWMSSPGINVPYVKEGWACLSFDYCGKTGDRPQYTKYLDRFSYANHDRASGVVVHDKTPDGKSITDPRQSADYVWSAIARRALSYLEQQKEVDRTRLGAIGYSYGGTLLWALGTDPRIKAIVPHFGIGWIEYWRNNAVWMYNNPYVEPPKTPGENLFLATMAPEAYVPYITAPTLYLNGSNDHHGCGERGLESFKRFAPGVPWSFAVQARGHHNTDKLDQDTKMWLEKYVLGRDIFWPEHPKSAITLDADGVPELRVTPASPERVQKVEMVYAQKEPVCMNRNWRDITPVRQGDTWVAKMPVLHVNDYVFGYANLIYDTTVVRSTDFNAAIPSKLGSAKATDTAPALYTGDGGLGAWSNVVETEGIGGIKGFRCTDNTLGTATELTTRPEWKAVSPKAQLSFKFYCTQPQTLILTADDFATEIEITAAEDRWQDLQISENTLLNPSTRKCLASWKGVSAIHLKPKADADITKVLFAQFKWVVPETPPTKKK